MTDFDLYDNYGKRIGQLRSKDPYPTDPAAYKSKEELDELNRQRKRDWWWQSSQNWRWLFGVIFILIVIIYFLSPLDPLNAKRGFFEGLVSFIFMGAVGYGVGQLVGIVVFPIARKIHENNRQ